jgi:hypothetical protein
MVFAVVTWSALATSAETSHFACKAQGNGNYRPYYLQALPGSVGLVDWSEKPKGLLGQNPMRSESECLRAVAASNAFHGVICSRTGLDGWKPTIYTGTRPGRPDFGYLGGSSIAQFEDCLEATASSSEKGVCFWGGSEWWISPIDKEGMAGGPFRTLSECVAVTAVE